MVAPFVFILFAVVLSRPPVLVAADVRDLIDFMDAVEVGVQEFALDVEQAYNKRCNPGALSDCEGSHYSACKSALNSDSKTCPPWQDKKQLKAAGCGDGIECNGFVDFERSGVNVPVTTRDGDNGSPEDPGVVETICFGSLFEAGMKHQFDNTSALFEAAASVPEAPFLFFGASDGVFRTYPARPWRSCDYDPRTRPWYVAASTTPKSVVIILDVSGYPRQGEFEHVKETAKALVEAMGNGDRVSVVFMGDTPEVADVDDASGAEEGDVMDQATNQVQNSLMRIISDRKTTSSPDTGGAFNLAFDLLEKTIDANVVDCDVAVVLLTSEKNLARIQNVQNIILERKQTIESLTNRTMLFFGYNAGTEITDGARSLECGLGAVWSIMDSSKVGFGVVESVRLFHEAFAFDLGRSIAANETLTGVATWSEPYTFFQLQLRGTTVAAPVFDRTQSPPVFLGVVGIDMLLTAFNKTVEPDAASNIRKQINARQQRQCGLSFSPCDLEALRQRSRRFISESSVAANTPICVDDTDECETSVPPLDRTTCSAETTTLPSTVWHNLAEDGVDYVERTCCAVENKTNQETGNDIVVQCPSEGTVVPDDKPPTLAPSSAPSEGGVPTPRTKTKEEPKREPSSSSSGGLGKFAIGGIIGGVIVIVVFCIVLVALRLQFLLLSGRNKEEESNENGTGPQIPTEIRSVSGVSRALTNSDVASMNNFGGERDFEKEEEFKEEYER